LVYHATVITFLAWLAPAALGQTFDGTGMVLPPVAEDPSVPLLGLGGAPADGGSVSLLGEAATNTVVQELRDGDQVVIEPVVGSLFGVGLSGSAPVHRRVDVGLSAPVWLATDGLDRGAALGDLHLWVPVRVVDRGPVRLAAVPFGRLPTGPDARYLGDPAGGGLLASAGVSAGPVFAHGDLGFDVGGATAAPDWPGAGRLRFAVDGGVRVGDVALHAEVRGRSPVGAALPSVPTEGLLAVRGRAVERVSLSLGAGRAITRGVGAAGLRLFVGTSVRWGKDDAMAEPEVVSKPVREVNIIDPLRLPVRGATIVAGKTERLSDHEGFADLPLKAVRSGEMTITAPGFLPRTVAISTDDPYWEVQLERAPVPVAVGVVGPDGVPVEALVTLVGPTDAGAPDVDAAGVQTWALPEGSWTVAIEAEGYGAQERTVVVDERRVDPIRVDAILTEEESPDTRLAVKVVDALGRPVEDAVVAVESRDLGTTGSGGDLTVEGLEAGEHAIVVRSTTYGQAVVSEVVLTDDDVQEVVVPLDWQDGSVLVQVTGPDGQPTDAEITFEGPESLPERAVGSDGEELFVLRPGRWDVGVRSATLAPQRRVVEVVEGEGGLTTLAVALQPAEEGDASLMLSVVDPDGWPVRDLEVSLDNASVGRTGPEGTLELRELQRGVRFVQLQGDLVVPRLTEVDLVGERQQSEVVVWWVDGVVDIEVVGEDNRPLNATIHPHGEEDYPPFGLGLDGFERRVLAPGTWALEASMEGLETRSRHVEVPSGTHRRLRVPFRLEPPAPTVGQLTLVVRTPEGAKPPVARVFLGGEPAGDAVNGFFQLDGVPLGPLDVAVEVPGLAPWVQSVDVEELTEVPVQPAWGPGAVRVRALGPEGPVAATLAAVGPANHPTVELTGGERLLTLAPGAWTLTASYDGLATVDEQVDLPDEPVLTEVVLTMAPPEPVVRLSLVSPNDVPLVGAEVVVDGEVVGTTDGAGQLSVVLPDDVDMATITLTPGDPVLSPTQIEVAPKRGEQRVDLVAEYKPVEVPVEVVVAPGAVAAAEGTTPLPAPASPTPAARAELVAYGAGAAEGQVVDGEGALALTPGTWTVTGRTEGGEVGTARVVVPSPGPDGSMEPPDVVSLQLQPVATREDGGVLRPESPLLFDLDQAVLRDDALSLADDMARWLLADRTVALVEVAGHTDDQGGVVYNQELSERRALAVRAALMARGVAPERLVARGYGLSRPVNRGTDETSRQANRRVELRVIRRAGE